MAGSTDWFRDSFRTEYEKQNAALGRFNLAIFGKTGVGKSTLINAIFGEEVARTGIGEPVTQTAVTSISTRSVTSASLILKVSRWARTTSRSWPNSTRP